MYECRALSGLWYLSGEYVFAGKLRNNALTQHYTAEFADNPKNTVKTITIRNMIIAEN